MSHRTEAVGRRACWLAGGLVPLLAGCLFSGKNANPVPPRPGVVRAAASEIPRLPPGLFPPAAQPAARRPEPAPAAEAPVEVASASVVPVAATVRPADTGLAAVRRLYDRAASEYAKMDGFVARLRRRERVGRRESPMETLTYRFRKSPLSVHLLWVGEGGKGREVVFCEGKHNSQMFVRLASGDVPFMPAGKVMRFDPESPLVRGNSRHSIRNSGFDKPLADFGELLTLLEQGRTDAGSLRAAGRQVRPEYPEITGGLECLEHTIAPGREPLLPKGGRRSAFFHPDTGLPVLLVTRDETGTEVEYYCFDRFQYPVNLDDADFDPRALWPGVQLPS